MNEHSRLTMSDLNALPVGSVVISERRGATVPFGKRGTGDWYSTIGGPASDVDLMQLPARVALRGEVIPNADELRAARGPVVVRRLPGYVRPKRPRGRGRKVAA